MNNFSPPPVVSSPRKRPRMYFVFTIGSAMVLTAALRLTYGGRSPVLAFSKQSRETGALVFHEKGCEHCHGADGIGTDRGPDLSGVGKRWHKDHIEQQIREGGGGMPPFGDALSNDEVKSLVDFLSAKRKPSRTLKDPKPQVPVKPSSDDSGI